MKTIESAFKTADLAISTLDNLVSDVVKENESLKSENEDLKLKLYAYQKQDTDKLIGDTDLLAKNRELIEMNIAINKTVHNLNLLIKKLRDENCVLKDEILDLKENKRDKTP